MFISQTERRLNPLGAIYIILILSTPNSSPHSIILHFTKDISVYTHSDMSVKRVLVIAGSDSSGGA